MEKKKKFQNHPFLSYLPQLHVFYLLGLTLLHPLLLNHCQWYDFNFNFA